MHCPAACGNPVSSQQAGSLCSPKIILPLDSPDSCNLMGKGRTSYARGSPEKSRGQSEVKDYSVPQTESITFARTKPGMLLKPAHIRKPSTTRIDSEVLSSAAEVKNIIETKSILDTSAHSMLQRIVHRRRLSNANFDVETLSVSSESKTSSETKIDFNVPKETVIKNVPESPEESCKEDYSDKKNVLEKIENMLPQTTEDENCEWSNPSIEAIKSHLIDVMVSSFDFSDLFT